MGLARGRPFVTRGAVVILDLGTSTVKCGCIDSRGSVAVLVSESFPLVERKERCEVDFLAYEKAVLRILAKVADKARRKSCRVSAILITGQAQTFAPVDGEFLPLSKGMVWLDARAKEEGKYLEQQLPDFKGTAGLARPFPELYVSKLLWLKRHKAALFQKASFFPLIHEYIAYCLTGRYFTDSASVGMTGLLDIRTGKLNNKILGILGLSRSVFPEIAAPATMAHVLTEECCRSLGLGRHVHVALCGNDQAASALGAGVSRIGDVSVNFGTAMVAFGLSKTMATDVGESQMAGLAPAYAPAFLLSYDAQAGKLVAQLKKKYFPELSWDRFFGFYRQVAGKAVPSDFKISGNRVICPSVRQKEVLAGFVMRYLLQQFQVHVARVAGARLPKVIYVSGGMAESKVWLGLLRKSARSRLVLSHAREAGLIGARRIYREKTAERSVGRCNHGK